MAIPLLRFHALRGLTGDGWLYQEFLRLKARLEADGLFDPARKRPLPLHPRVIGIITSPTGAALQDMLNTLRGRYTLCEVVVAPAMVQGDDAPLTICAALEQLLRQANPDVVILARGGGSLEDLWAFNDERVVRAVAACPVPVITGIGHETDFTLCDFAADLRAPTPTGAAVLCTPDRADLRRELLSTAGELATAFSDRLYERKSELREVHHQLDRLSPLWQVQNGLQRLDELSERLARSLSHSLQLKRARAQALSGRWTALNPLGVLQRGYALVTGPDGRLVSSTGQVQAGDDVQVRLSDGRLGARVTQVQADGGQESS
jgi:exodeoxyribonuclease VII large subunit